MKKTLLFNLLCVFCANVFAQIPPKEVGTATQVIQPETDLISGKRWKAVKYVKNNKPVQLKGLDFAWFRTGGKYECALLNVFDKGNWIYDAGKKQITITTSRATTPKVWDVTETNANSLKVKSGVEVFEFIPDIAINELQATNSPENLFCKTWKIVEHKKGLLSIKYQPMDFCRLFADGNYDQCLLTFYGLGKWMLENNNQQLSILNAGTKTTWQIKEITEARLLLVKDGGKETLVLKADEEK